MADEQVILTFLKGRDGKTIARNNQGKICLLDIAYCKENKIWVSEGEDWRCAVKIDKKNVMIVQPITRTLTAKENAELFEIKARQFQKDGFKQREPVKGKDKKKSPASGLPQTTTGAGD